MQFTIMELIGTIMFGLAVTHTFLVGKFTALSHKFPKESVWSNIFHLLGEVEAVFALWASLFMAIFIGIEGWDVAIRYQQSLNFIEPFFIFVIMVVCSTRPILAVARKAILAVSTLCGVIFKTPQKITDMFVIMILGPLSGSFITEPAAMTVTAFLLNSMLQKNESKLLYGLLAVLFVNVSIGGALTPFAAPPILMVAQTWGWDLNYVFMSFGWKAAIAICVNAFLLVLLFRKSISENCITLQEVETRLSGAQAPIPVMITFVHLAFLVGIVLTAHYQNAFMGLFLLFLGVASVSQRYHDSLRLKESLLVALFLGGIIQFGAFQKWWLTPLLSNMDEFALFLGAAGLTAVTDNAALTFLGSQVDGLSDLSKYALVAGAIGGGGLTIIANAPNAAGYSILSKQFPDGLSPVQLLKMALVPTLIALGCLWLL